MLCPSEKALSRYNSSSKVSYYDPSPHIKRSLNGQVSSVHHHLILQFTVPLGAGLVRVHQAAVSRGGRKAEGVWGVIAYSSQWGDNVPVTVEYWKETNRDPC